MNSYRATEFDNSITEISPSYFAGQIDGTVNQNFVIAKPSGRRRLPLFRVNISSKNSRVVQILHEVYGGSINKNNVVMEGNGAAQFAEDIGKYLIFKRDGLIESIDSYLLQIPANNKSEVPRKLKALQDKLLKTKT